MIVEFKIDTEQEPTVYLALLQAVNMQSALFDICNYARANFKYKDTPDTAQTVYEKILAIINDYNIQL